MIKFWCHLNGVNTAAKDVHGQSALVLLMKHQSEESKLQSFEYLFNKVKFDAADVSKVLAMAVENKDHEIVKIILDSKKDSYKKGIKQALGDSSSRLSKALTKIDFWTQHKFFEAGY